jgi:Recombination endonuclease VII
VQVPEKHCPRCDKMKPLDAFSQQASGQYGKASRCRECEKVRHRQYRSSHTPDPIKKRAQNQKYYALCQERRAEDAEYAEAYTLRERRKSQSRDKRKGGLRRRGVTLDQYQEMYKAQHGLCALCGNPEKIKNTTGVIALAVDHDHVTGKIRGLLCMRCNVNLSILEDAEFVEKAQPYLKRTIV